MARRPTVLFIQGYRVVFFSADHDEPPHVHVSKAGCAAKFWREPLQLAANFGLRRHELGDIVRLLPAHQPRLIQAWHEYFG
jgi:hypothetical protein